MVLLWSCIHTSLRFVANGDREEANKIVNVDYLKGVEVR